MLERLLLGALMFWALLSVLFRNTRTNPIAENLESDLRNFIRRYTYPKSYVEFWMDVSGMETNNYTSRIFKNNLNPWGMKVAKRRETTQSNSYGLDTWAAYDSLTDAAQDICLWMDAVKFSKNISQLDAFVTEMKSKGYFVGESAFTYYQKVLAQKKIKG